MLGDTNWQQQGNDGRSGRSAREVRRQTRQLQVSVWAPTPQIREKISIPVDVALALVNRMTMLDGSCALLSYTTSAQHDEQQKVRIYRRDLVYDANYATVQIVDTFTIKHTELTVSAGPTMDAQGPEITITH